MLQTQILILVFLPSENHYVGLVYNRRKDDPLQDRVYAFYNEKSKSTDLYSERWTPYVSQVCTVRPSELRHKDNFFRQIFLFIGFSFYYFLHCRRYQNNKRTHLELCCAEHLVAAFPSLVWVQLITNYLSLV